MPGNESGFTKSLRYRFAAALPWACLLGLLAFNGCQKLDKLLTRGLEDENMKLHRSILLLTLLFVSSVCLAQPPTRSCGADTLPAGISGLLESRFEGWRIRTVEDMESYDRQLWTKSKPDECPGITSGRFFSPMKQAFAVLLIPQVPDRKGYKVIAFAESDTKSSFTPMVVVESAEERAADIAIYRLPPGLYTDPERTRRVRIKLDALQVERMEVSTTLYFWRSDHFEHLVTSN